MKLSIVSAVAFVSTAAPFVPSASSSSSEYDTRLTATRWANAYCESAGNPHAIGYRGWYRGKWQFDQRTWDTFAPRAYKGRDPAWAPEWVQDRAALNVTYDAWPNC